MNRLLDGEQRFSWPRLRHSILNRKMIAGGKIEDFCTEIVFAERFSEDYSPEKKMKLGEIWRDLITDTQIATEKFIGFCEMRRIQSIQHSAS